MIHLPVEIWRYILRYAIDCPEFLYIDLVPKGRPTDEATYWASERTRNALRGVCSSWNRFLATYCHRYIRISDIFHDTVPPASLPNATRIRIDECYCLHCNTFINDHVGLISRFEHYVNSAHTGTGATTWRVEIVDAEMNDYLDVIALEPSRISNLRALWHWRGDLPDNIFSAGPPLSIMGTCADDLAKMKRLDISKIKSIHIHDINQTNLGVVHFPNLTHACLEVDLTSQTSRNRVNQVFDWLEVHGKRLETFYWIDYLSEITNSEVDKIWSLCPHMRRLHLPLNAKWTSPPSSHTLQLLRVLSFEQLSPDGYSRLPVPCSLCNHSHAGVVQFSHYLPQIAASGVGRIKIMALAWHQMFEDDNEHIFCFWTQAKSHAIDVVDISGLTFELALVAYLEEYKRRSVCK
ncbi:hypothetical protein PIIN_03213 [Serendipita indica DSM 11827]|uniref:Uncharacterized protein n=1 Tax=Serendipita indica (strain DSM 11827) TaxID=1109443 RepID=G4TDC1_SERID|nr:hypothetical protein PIIN_03213 [Serendipita indica DSM 11827]